MDLKANSYDGPKKSYYICEISGNLLDENEAVTTNTELNLRSNGDVTSVLYNVNNYVKFIPNSLFNTFANLEALFVSTGNDFVSLKPQYLKNAKKLKVFKVYRNDVKELTEHLFVEASNLEHINFEENQIESIHKLAFSCLPNLQGIYLGGNRIKNLSPSTFSAIANLNILDLFDNVCMKQKFLNANQKVDEVEAVIGKACTDAGN